MIARLPEVLGRLADNWEANGGHVHFAADAAEAREIVLAIADRHGVKRSSSRNRWSPRRSA